MAVRTRTSTGHALFLQPTPAGLVTYAAIDKRIRLLSTSGRVLEELQAMESLKAFNYPLKCKYIVTGKCNQRCYHCYAESRFQISGLGTDDAIKVIDHIAEAGTLFIEFFGGEVGLRSDFVELLRRAADRNLVISFFTNGTLFERHHLAEFPPSDSFSGIVVSILAGTEAEHDRLCRFKGAWERAWNFAETLRDAGYPVSLSVSVTRENATSLNRLMCVAESRRLRLRTIFNTYSEISRRRDILNLALNDDEFLELGRATPSLAKMRFSYKPCFGGSVTYAIDPNGDLLACDHVTTSLGNVLKDPIAPLWAATEAREFSRQVYDTPDGCRSCPDELRQYCTYCPASTLNAGIPHAEWVAHFCALAKRKRLMHFEAFRTGRS